MQDCWLTRHELNYYPEPNPADVLRLAEVKSGFAVLYGPANNGHNYSEDGKAEHAGQKQLFSYRNADSP